MTLTVVKDEYVPDSRKADLGGTAEFFGVQTSTIKNWVARGCPYLVRGGGRLKPWSFDLLTVAKWKFEPETMGEFDPEQLAPKERLDWYKGSQERDKYRQAQGELIHRNDVKLGWIEILQTLKGRLLALPSRLAPDMVVIEEIKTAEAKIRDEIHTMLDEVSGGEDKT